MSKLIDLTGQDFGLWHVLKRAENNKTGHAIWLCQCMGCGETIKPVDGTHLRSGSSKGCRKCQQKKIAQANIKHEEGKTYGFLFIERIATEEEKPRQDKTGVYWNCTCTKCGRKNVIVLGDYLRNGDTKSCGCINSFNENKICQILDKLNFKYVQQQTFKDLISASGTYGGLRFDFAIYNQNTLSYIIEYDGIQHFERGHFPNTFDITHKNDLLKNQYCFTHNIPLIRIPYDREYSINDLKLETTQFLLTKDNEKQYYEERASIE